MPNQIKHAIRASHAAALVCVAMCVAAAGQTPERSRTQGLKETDRFIKTGGSTSQSVAMAKLELQNTLTAYNALVSEPSKNMKSDYKRLLKASDVMNNKVAEARSKVAAMQDAGDTYFRGRGETIKNVQNEALRQQAQERLQQSQRDFTGVLASLRAAGESLEPIRKQLSDQIHFLGSDLNPSAAASLKPQADKLNADANTAFSKADHAIANANEYFKGLSARS